MRVCVGGEGQRGREGGGGGGGGGYLNTSSQCSLIIVKHNIRVLLRQVMCRASPKIMGILRGTKASAAAGRGEAPLVLRKYVFDMGVADLYRTHNS